MSTAKGKDIVRPETQIPADVLAEMEKSTGAGLSTDARDNLVPLAYLLQKLSPQCEERDPRYIVGAKAGDIWLRGAPQELWKGDEGVLFQPCYNYRDWIEWVPRDRGGGFVARHAPLYGTDDEHDRDDCPIKDAKKHVDPQNPNKVRWVRPNGNELVMTRNFAGYVLNGTAAWPFVIPMSSSGHTTARQWMTDMNQRITPGGKKIDANWHKYRITSRLRTNSFGTWYVWLPTHEGYVSIAEANRGKALYTAFESGEKEAAAPEREDDGAARSDENAPM
jgi:hypothetical protein